VNGSSPLTGTIKRKENNMDLIFGLVIGLLGVGFTYYMLTPDNTPDNLAGYFFKILIGGAGIILIGFALLAIF